MTKGDPFRETEVLVSLQRLVPQATLPVARGMSFFGEHAAGWMALGLVGAVVDKRRRGGWCRLALAALISHAASVALKRVVRRPRPADERITIGVSTPSKLSFPSSHATSTTAALVSLTTLTGSRIPLVGVPLMMLSRMMLGVHYPTDVAAGALLGALTAKLVQERQ
ncbi:phosphatase PAP2 family protein [Corynebacterium sp.]|uniref:phosphatase PAP2 family protein n=1 Tax=Corynebacterium sp. TaxID=1720 RepID=UPI0026DC88D5|nr:phosphatase PAP2 family protein [Corynebacterium sp.]MDO5076725.1 phosphatase PAP2 family protein [Corynebacterium sp.]